MASLVFSEGICAFNSSNSGMRFYFIKEDVGLRVSDSIRKNFEDVSLNMMTVFLWIQQLFPDLMERGKAICGDMSMIVSNSGS